MSGLGGCLGAAAGIAVQQAVGHLAAASTWTPVFLGCALSYCLAQTLVVALVPDLGRLRAPGSGLES